MDFLYDYLGDRLDVSGGGSGDGFKDVTAYGIDNSGQTDVSAAINELIGNGGMFYFPPGLYLLNGQLEVPSNTWIKGAGGQTVFKAADTLDAVYHTICNKNASNTAARLCRNTQVDGHPAVSEFISDYDSNIVLMDFKVDGNWQGRDLDNWEKVYMGHGVAINREPGTNIEIQAAHNVLIENVIAIHGIQHNINIRGGAYGYNMGVTYECLFPAYRCTIRNCEARNERYDDCITTHDCYDVLIDNCVASVENNANGTYNQAVSNGFEIDDGSRDVEVRNCKSYYGVGGYQAKGHDNTPPAYNITFRDCASFYNMYPFTMESGPATEYAADQLRIDGRCKNIRIVDCYAIQPYCFSNAKNWKDRTIAVRLMNTLNVFVDGLYIENTGAPEGAENDYGPEQEIIFLNLRNTCLNTYVNNVSITSPITNDHSNSALFLISNDSTNVTLRNIVLNGFTGNPIVRVNRNDANHFLTIDGIYSKRLAASDKVLQVADTTADSQILLKGSRTNMVLFEQ